METIRAWIEGVVSEEVEIIKEIPQPHGKCNIVGRRKNGEQVKLHWSGCQNAYTVYPGTD